MNELLSPVGWRERVRVQTEYSHLRGDDVVSYLEIVFSVWTGFLYYLFKLIFFWQFLHFKVGIFGIVLVKKKWRRNVEE